MAANLLGTYIQRHAIFVLSMCIWGLPWTVRDLQLRQNVEIVKQALGGIQEKDGVSSVGSAVGSTAAAAEAAESETEGGAGGGGGPGAVVARK